MSKFLAAFEKKAKEHYADAREAEPGSNRIRMNPGSYVGVLTMEGEVIATGTMKGVPQLIETITVDEGEYVGASVAKKFTFSEDYGDRAFTQLVKRLKTLFPEDSADLSQFDEAGIKEYIGDKLGEEYRVQFSVIDTEIEEKDGPDKGKKKSLRYYDVDCRVADAEAPKAAKGKAKPAKAAEPEPEAEEEAVEEEAAEDWTPTKGDIVLYKPPGKRRSLEYTVLTVNKTKQTVTLKDDDGEKLSDVEFDKLEPIEESEEE
jgi:hypothetical protein